MRTNLESLKTFTKDELVMRVEKLENSNTRLTSAVQEFLIETKEEYDSKRSRKVECVTKTRGGWRSDRQAS